MIGNTAVNLAGLRRANFGGDLEDVLPDLPPLHRGNISYDTDSLIPARNTWMFDTKSRCTRCGIQKDLAEKDLFTTKHEYVTYAAKRTGGVATRGLRYFLTFHTGVNPTPWGAVRSYMDRYDCLKSLENIDKRHGGGNCGLCKDVAKSLYVHMYATCLILRDRFDLTGSDLSDTAKNVIANKSEKEFTWVYLWITEDVKEHIKELSEAIWSHPMPWEIKPCLRSNYHKKMSRLANSYRYQPKGCHLLDPTLCATP